MTLKFIRHIYILKLSKKEDGNTWVIAKAKARVYLSRQEYCWTAEGNMQKDRQKHVDVTRGGQTSWIWEHRDLQGAASD